MIIFVPPAVQSLSKQSDLETVVKTLAPALLAELAKMKSTSSSSVGEKPSSSSASKQSAKKASTASDTQRKRFSVAPSLGRRSRCKWTWWVCCVLSLMESGTKHCLSYLRWMYSCTWIDRAKLNTRTHNVCTNIMCFSYFRRMKPARWNWRGFITSFTVRWWLLCRNLGRSSPLSCTGPQRRYCTYFCLFAAFKQPCF